MRTHIRPTGNPTLIVTSEVLPNFLLPAWTKRTVAGEDQWTRKTRVGANASHKMPDMLTTPQIEYIELCLLFRPGRGRFHITGVCFWYNKLLSLEACFWNFLSTSFIQNYPGQQRLYLFKLQLHSKGFATCTVAEFDHEVKKSPEADPHPGERLLN
jgi:hypothetical protein